jgi:hypothetical protein
MLNKVNSIQFKSALSEFISTLNEFDTFQACWAGTIWVFGDALRAQSVSKDSFEVFPRGFSDSRKGMLLVLDLDGLPERFVLESDEDDDGNPVIPNHCQIMYDHAAGIKALLECDDFDSIVGRLEFYLEMPI